MKNLDDDFEPALTKQSYYDTLDEFDQALEDRKVVLTDNEKTTIDELNKLAYQQAVLLLVKAHRTEFERLLQDQRIKADIHGLVESNYSNLLKEVLI